MNEAKLVLEDKLRERIKRDGPGAVAFYLSGQLLTEDYYVANKLMKGFIGSANVDTNSRLCMSSTVAGHRRAFGADTVPGCYEDLDEADLLVLVGSNAAWCHPVLFQRMLANKQGRGARIVVIDPRRTDTAGDADLFLGLKPGTDTALFSGLLPRGFETCTQALGSSAWAMAAFLFATGMVLSLPGLPLEWYDQFRLEDRFGFNTTTQKLWWMDRLKGLLPAIGIFVSLITMLLLIFHVMGLY